MESGEPLTICLHLMQVVQLFASPCSMAALHDLVCCSTRESKPFILAHPSIEH